MAKKQREPTVIISEPHLFSTTARYGGHQYAKVFARNGWKVILLSANFNIMRLFYNRSSIEDEYVRVWREKGRSVNRNITNYCLAQVLPTKLRYQEPFSHIAHHFYIPSIKSILKMQNTKEIDLLWLNGNQDWLYRRMIPHKKMIIRIIDDYSGFRADYDIYHPMMIETMKQADCVFACSEHVQRQYTGKFDEIIIAPNGVDYPHFNQPIKNEPELLQNIPHPRVIYVGAIANWFDFGLVTALAQRLPNCSFVIFGQWNRETARQEQLPENVHFLGPVDYDKLPGVLSYSDVGIVPFKDIELVRGISPIKVYEYLAARLPVVSLRWGELAREKLPIFLASNIGEFEQGIIKSLSMPEEQKNQLREAVRSRSWENRLENMLNQIDLKINPFE